MNKTKGCLIANFATVPIAAARAQQKARHRCRAPAPSLGP
uniref:Uncharacterized protein n=1 Tax=Escherichia coli TaxID=562 RepID=A0A6G9HPF3_ECOLX|nr:hypothetical protein [Escherichia coli]UFD96114.1 hypothetical protein [Escherichia coli]